MARPTVTEIERFVQSLEADVASRANWGLRDGRWAPDSEDVAQQMALLQQIKDFVSGKTKRG